jgi:hypothetical protein
MESNKESKIPSFDEEARRMGRDTSGMTGKVPPGMSQSPQMPAGEVIALTRPSQEQIKAVMDNAATTPRPPSINGELNTLFERCELLESAINELGSRLEPITFHTPQEACKQPVEPDNCEYVNKLRTACNKLDMLADQVRYMNSVIQI